MTMQFLGASSSTLKSYQEKLGTQLKLIIYFTGFKPNLEAK